MVASQSIPAPAPAHTNQRLRRIAVFGGPASLVQNNFRRKLQNIGGAVTWHVPKGRTAKTAGPLPLACEAVIVVKDFCSHDLADYAKAQAQARGIPFAFARSQMSNSVGLLRETGVVPMVWDATKIEPEVVVLTHPGTRPIAPVPVLTLAPAPSKEEVGPSKLPQLVQDATHAVLETSPEVFLNLPSLHDEVKGLLARELQGIAPADFGSLIEAASKSFRESWRDPLVRQAAMQNWLDRSYAKALAAGVDPPGVALLESDSYRIFGCCPPSEQIRASRAKAYGPWAAKLIFASAAETFLRRRLAEEGLPEEFLSGYQTRFLDLLDTKAIKSFRSGPHRFSSQVAVNEYVESLKAARDKALVQKAKVEVQKAKVEPPKVVSTYDDRLDRVQGILEGHVKILSEGVRAELSGLAPALQDVLVELKGMRADLAARDEVKAAPLTAADGLRALMELAKMTGLEVVIRPIG